MPLRDSAFGMAHFQFSLVVRRLYPPIPKYSNPQIFETPSARCEMESPLMRCHLEVEMESPLIEMPSHANQMASQINKLSTTLDFRICINYICFIHFESSSLTNWILFLFLAMLFSCRIYHLIYYLGLLYPT